MPWSVHQALPPEAFDECWQVLDMPEAFTPAVVHIDDAVPLDDGDSSMLAYGRPPMVRFPRIPLCLGTMAWSALYSAGFNPSGLERWRAAPFALVASVMSALPAQLLSAIFWAVTIDVGYLSSAEAVWSMLQLTTVSIATFGNRRAAILALLSSCTQVPACLRRPPGLPAAAPRGPACGGPQAAIGGPVPASSGSYFSSME